MTARKFPLELPAPVAAYWMAANAGDCATAAAQFAENAVVHDEGRSHRTPSAIAAWIGETTRKYRPVVEPLRSEAAGHVHRIAARVSGNFPGSPLELDYAFTVTNGKIARLEIT